MRMCEYDYSNTHWVDLFNEMFDKGVFIHHVSNEYESFEIIELIDKSRDFSLTFFNFDFLSCLVKFRS